MLKISFILYVFISVAPLSLTFSILDILNKEENYCYVTNKNPYKYSATKTAYDIIHGDQFYGKIPNCEPVQFWSLIRHGTRYPGKENLKDLKKLPEVQAAILRNYENEVPNYHPDKLCEQDVELLKNWKWDSSINKSIASNLHPQGWIDLKLLALRNKARFSNLLSLPYSEKDFLFRHTKTQRTEASFKAFAGGLFGEESKKIRAISFENDTLIQTYKNCKYWQKEVDENPESLKEYNNFINGPIYAQFVSNISNRLGFKSDLSQSIIKTMYDMCRFDEAWHLDDKSPWCIAFTKEQLQILEYMEDLMYYYLIGYGHELNPKVGCMPLKDMMQRFENVIKGNKEEPKGIFYFSHSSELELSMTAFDMKKDKIPLTGDNMDQQKNRLWRTSILGPFTANINSVLYKCTEGDKNRVAIYLNEKPYTYEGCSKGICSWEVIKEKFLQEAQNCNLDFCQNDDKMPYKVSKWIEES